MVIDFEGLTGLLDTIIAVTFMYEEAAVTLQRYVKNN